MRSFAKKTISLLLSIVMALSVFGGLRLPAFALDEVLEIRTVDDWNRFAGSYETDSGIYQRKTVRLLADVGPVTTRFWGEFNGTFDGGGHTLTVNIGNGGLFSSIGGGAVKNLTVAGAFSSLGGDEGALVTTVIINSDCVISNVRITADVSSSGGAVAGFVGWCEEYSRLVIENSAFEGGLFGNTAAGFVNFCTGSSVTIKNSVFSGYCENAKNFSTVGYTDGDGYASSATIQNVKTNTPDVYGGLEWWRTPLYNTALPTDAGYSPAAAQSLINRIGDVAYTAECKAKIDKARAVYDTLTADEKQQVTNAAVLTAAEEAYAALEAEANQAAVAPVEALIADIGENDGSDAYLARIATAYVLYSKLSDTEKSQVTNANVLQAAIDACPGCEFGSCGDRVGYAWDKTAGKLVIGGSGDMKDYDTFDPNDLPPWYGKNLSSIVIGSGVTGVGNGAFYHFGGNPSVSLPEGLTKIGYRAFYFCEELQNIVLPESLTEIGEQAFYGCYKLESMTIPGSVQRIGASTFCGCYSLVSFTIPDNVKSIGISAFSECKALQTVTIHDGITEIGESAFLNCPKLKTVNFTGSEAQWNAINKGGHIFDYYDYEAFEYCDRPADEMPEILFNYCEDGDIFWHYNETTKTLTVGGSGATKDDTVTMNPGEIPHPWNTYAVNAETLVIKPGVTGIGNYGFARFRALKNVTIPDTVTAIGKHAFDSCEALLSVTLPDGITSVQDGAFSRCYSLQSVTLPDSVTSIGRASFLDCDALETVTLPEGLLSIGVSAFRSCEKLDGVTLPESLTSIGSYAFSECSALTAVTIPGGVASVGSQAFWKCSSLQSLTIQNGVQSIGDFAFQGCVPLENVILPESVTTLGRNAFFGCESLKSVTIPRSVTSIGKFAFQNCAGLETVNFIGSEAQWNAVEQGEYVFGFWDEDTDIDRDRTEEEALTFIFYYGVEGAINAIGDIGDVEYTDECKARIDTARKAYDKLSKHEMTQVTNAQVLYDAETAYAKLAAKAELESYKDPADYRADEQAALAEAIAAGNAAIDAATSVADVATALTDAKAAIDAIKTDAELTAEEALAADQAAFDAYKTAQKAAADALAEEGDSDASAALIEAAKTAIDDVAYNENADLAANEAVVDAILTKLADDLAAQREADKPPVPVKTKECPICGKIHNGHLFDVLLGEVHWWMNVVIQIIRSFG